MSRLHTSPLGAELDAAREDATGEVVERAACEAVCRDIASRSGDAGEADACADAIAARGAP